MGGFITTLKFIIIMGELEELINNTSKAEYMQEVATDAELTIQSRLKQIASTASTMLFESKIDEENGIIKIALKKNIYNHIKNEIIKEVTKNTQQILPNEYETTVTVENGEVIISIEE